MPPSPFARILRIANILIAALLLAAVAVVYWFCWRPLPRRSGAVTAPLEAPASVAFDAVGVPHIRAATLDDALFVQGYVTAQDRLFQMDALRRLASGSLAEVLGPALLDSDREARRMRMRRLAEEAYTAVPANDRAALAAYARGVNHFISTHLDALPVEFTLLGYQPRPWSVVDSILICLYMYRDLTSTWRDEVLKRVMMSVGDPAKVNFLFPVRSGAEPPPGSNAWALSGSHTASGKPLLSNDIHLGYSLPGIWYEAHLQTPDLDVAGVSLPGVPGIIAGHNRRIAWGVTNLGFDVQDLYIEKIDERTGRYLYRGQVEQARPEREIIRVKGQASTELAVWVTRHGPLFLSDGNDRMALRWVPNDTSAFQFPVLDLNRARNWEEFRAALARWPGPGQNFVYADVDGNIGYQAAGKLPVRRGYAGDLPVDGSSGDFDWDGYIPFDNLPSAFNPPGGMIATANQNPFPPDSPWPVNGNFAPPYRVRQILDRLTAGRRWTPEGLLRVQTDVYSGFERFIAAQVVGAYDRRQAHIPALDPAIASLRDWNGQMDQDQGAPFLAVLLYQHIRTAMAESAAPGKAQAYTFQAAPAAVEKLLRERPPGWFRDYDEMLLRALADAVEEGGRIQGRDIARWRYGNYLRVTIAHPVVHQVPVVGKYFDIGPVPMSGSATTVKQTTRSVAPSMRMNADLGDWDRSLENLPIGESGQIFSRHYRDQWRGYYYGRGEPMRFRNVEAKSTLVFKTAR